MVEGLFGQIIAWAEHLDRTIALVGQCFEPGTIIVCDVDVYCDMSRVFSVTCVMLLFEKHFEL